MADSSTDDAGLAGPAAPTKSKRVRAVKQRSRGTQCRWGTCKRRHGENGCVLMSMPAWSRTSFARTTGQRPAMYRRDAAGSVGQSKQPVALGEHIAWVDNYVSALKRSDGVVVNPLTATAAGDPKYQTVTTRMKVCRKHFGDDCFVMRDGVSKLVFGSLPTKDLVPCASPARQAPQPLTSRRLSRRDPLAQSPRAQPRRLSVGAGQNMMEKPTYVPAPGDSPRTQTKKRVAQDVLDREHRQRGVEKRKAERQAALNAAAEKRKAGDAAMIAARHTLNDDRPKPWIDVARLGDMPYNLMRSKFGFGTLGRLKAFFDLLDCNNDLSLRTYTKCHGQRSKPSRYDAGTLVRTAEAGKARRPEPKEEYMASGTSNSSLDKRAKVEPIVIDKNCAFEATTTRPAPAKTYRVKPGRKIVHASWRCHLFVLLALYSGCGIEAAAWELCIGHDHYSRVFSTFVTFLHRSLLREQPKFSSKRSRSRMPQHWVDYLKTNDIKIVLDATEIGCEAPSVLCEARCFYSQYKHGYTVKFLIGVSAHGTIVFISEAYPGKISDFAITEVCGVLDWLEQGDLVLADRGFNIQALLSKIRAGILVGHTHAKGEKEKMGGKYTHDQTTVMKAYSNLRIHVERAMALIKRMGFLKNTIKLTHKHLAAPIVSIAAKLSNYGRPLLNREDAERVHY